MSNMKTYRVLREHEGDKLYLTGDDREAEPATVKHLVDLNVLEEVSTKAETQPKNKAEKAPKNKAGD